MSLTRANIEAVLVKRIGNLFDDLGLDGTTTDGTNADLNDPIAYALIELGYGVTDITDVSDTDTAAVSSENYNPLFDLAELRCLLTAYQNALILVNISVGPRSESLSQKAQQLDKAIQVKRKQLLDDYGIGRGTFTTSTLQLDFARHGDDTIY